MSNISRKSVTYTRNILCPSVLIMILTLSGPVFGAVLTAGYPTVFAPVNGKVAAAVPALVAKPGGAKNIDYVDIGLVASEKGHALAGWGGIVGDDPVTEVPEFGGEVDARVLWAAGAVDNVANRSASLNLNFGAAGGNKYLAFRWLHGISGADSFKVSIVGVAGILTVNDNTVSQAFDPTRAETWFDVGLWNVGALNGIKKVTLQAIDPVWGGQAGFGQVTFSEIAVFGLPVPAPVPIPAAVWLFGSGLAVLFRVARRRA